MSSALDVKLGSVVGGRTASVITRAFGYQSVGDLLAHYPRRYVRRGELTALNELNLDESVTIVAEVLEATERRMQAKKGTIQEVTISDGRGILKLTFFNQHFRMNELVRGARGMFSGKVGDYRGMRQLTHPDYELFESAAFPGEVAALAWASQPIPIYPATSTITSWKLKTTLELVLDSLPELDDPVPELVRVQRGLLRYSRALELIHRPEVDSDWGSARTSLRFQEAFVLQAALLRQRAVLRESPAEPRLPGALLSAFDAALPFDLTDDQLSVGDEIARDLASPTPMNRLVQGEVGSGKTLVALRAMLTVAESGGQSALLAPTEVLAGQHLRSIVASLGPDVAARLRPTLLTGQLSAAERRKALLAAVSGSAQIVIGTHALLGDAVEFFDLGLVVVDEQHRFGVDQREALRIKGRIPPHVLVLTATPIPRTVAMTVFGDLDVSTIAQLPAGRQPIDSFVVPSDRPAWVQRVWHRVSEELAKGHQSFVVCPAIDPSTAESDDPVASTGSQVGPANVTTANVTELTQSLRVHPLLGSARIEQLHGRMSSEEKDTVMRAFAAGDIDVLVATTVIEVGVDVPNASTMVVMDAERFGVSQLHQLRGRVGRGSVPGLALFVTNAQEDSIGRQRVDAVAATVDGFELAKVDLELRQEGDVLGNTQSGGRSSLRLLRVARDGELIGDARALAESVLVADPTLAGHPALKEALERRLDENSQAFLAKN